MASNVHSKEAQRHFVFGQLQLGKTGSDILSDLKTIHGDQALSKAAVYRWIEQFKDGRVDVAEDKTKRGRSKSPSTKLLVQRVRAIIEDNPCTSTREIADRTGCSSTSVVWKILTKDLQLTKLTARWVPRLLTAEMTSDKQDK